MTRSSVSSLYDDDFFAWTRQQAEALRRLPNHALNDVIDIAHLAEEIEDLGKRDLREVTSLLARLLEHLIKIDRRSGSESVPHWQAECYVFQAGACDAYTPSMRHLVEMSRIWKRARRVATVALDDDASDLSEPATCPFDLDDLLTEDFDVGRATAKLTAASRAAKQAGG